MAIRHEVNITTGERRTLPLTAVEEADAQARWLAEQNDPARLQALADDAARQEVAADAIVQFLRGATPAQVTQYVHDQINADGAASPAAVKAAVKAMEVLQADTLRILSVLVKQTLR